MKVQQVNDGTWYYIVNTSPQKTGFIWSRTSGPERVETFVSASSDAVWFTTDTKLNKLNQGFSSREAFLTWACGQLGGGTMYVWEMTSTVETSTHTCGS